MLLLLLLLLADRGTGEDFWLSSIEILFPVSAI
jgi:hypothetical protein